MKKHRRLALLLILTIVVSTGCAGFTTTDTLIVSGESLKASDKQFRRVAAAYVDGCDKVVPQQIPPTECATFKDFGQRWNKAFPLAADIWLAAKEAGDKLTVEGAAKAITGLVTELGKFSLRLLAMVSSSAGGK